MIDWFLRQWWRVFPSLRLRVYYRTIRPDLLANKVFASIMLDTQWKNMTVREQRFLSSMGADPAEIWRILG